MAKIYRRSNLLINVNPKKKDEKARKKNVIVNFRVTPEEKEAIFKRIELSGMKIQDYILQSCMFNKISVIGNVRTFDAIRKEMEVIDTHLMHIERAEELDLQVMESLRAILEILDGFYNKETEDR